MHFFKCFIFYLKICEYENIFSWPFFNEEERELVKKVSEFLRGRGYDVIVPMEYKIEGGEKMTNEEWARNVFRYDIDKIVRSDLVIAIYHGHYSDTGTAWELGYAAGTGIPSIVVHVNTENIASIMPVSGCSCNVKYEDLPKIDINNIIDNYTECKTSINAWIVEQK